MRLDLKPGESIAIGNTAVITLEKKSGNTARITVQVDKSIPVNRVEKPATGKNVAAGGITGAT